MKMLLNLIVTGCTADRLGHWLSSELSATYQGRFALPGGEYLSAFAECIPPEGENQFYQVVIHGTLKQSDTGRESFIDSLAWLVIRPILEERQHLTGFAYIYIDAIHGWIDRLVRNLRIVFSVEEVYEDTKRADYKHFVQTTFDGKADDVMNDLLHILEKVIGKEQEIWMKNYGLELSINTDFSNICWSHNTLLDEWCW